MRKASPASYGYIASLTENEGEMKAKARASAEKLGLGGISLSTAEGQLVRFFLRHLTEGTEPGKVVEIGTLTGLSALYILEAGCKVRLWTLEKSPEHARLAAEVLAEPIGRGRCEVLAGDAREKLAELQAEGPFDAVFIDGNKAAYLDYFDWALNHVRPGGLIVADNVFLAGAVWGAGEGQAGNFNPKQIQAVQEMNRRAFTDARLSSAIIPTEEGMLICKILNKKLS